MAAAPRGVTPRRATTAPPGRGTTVLQGSARRTAPPASRATNDRPRAVSRGAGGSGSLDTSVYPQDVPGLDCRQRYTSPWTPPVDSPGQEPQGVRADNLRVRRVRDHPPKRLANVGP